MARQDGDHVAMTLCYFCGEGSSVLLHKQLRSVAEFHNKVMDMEPCSKCADLMKQGVILITIDDAKSEPGWNKPPSRTVRTSTYGPSKEIPGIPNPYRTGGWFVVKDEAIQRAINNPDMAAWALKHRWMFIEHDAAVQIGLFDTVAGEPDAS